MTGFILLVLGIAMLAACGGKRDLAIGLFTAGVLASAVWLDHHMTDALTVAF
jgi:hypothetical protein